MTTATATASTVMPLAKRTKLALVVTALVLLPAIVMVVVTQLATGRVQEAATWASIPAIAGIVCAAAGGRRFAVICAVVMGLLAPMTIVAGLSPVSGAAVMALMCMTVGRLARVGLHRSGILVPIMLAWPLIDPPTWNGASTVDRTDTTYLLWMALIFFVGGIIPALLVPIVLRKRPRKPLQSHTTDEVVPYTVMITVLVTVSTFYVLDHPELFGGAFLVAAILVLAPLGRSQTLKPTIIRILATIAGSVFILAIVSQVHSLVVIYVIGLIAIVFALISRLGPRPWIYYVFMVPATACLNATSLAQVGELGRQRIEDNIVGGLLVLAASVIAIGYANWATKHGHAQDADVEAAAVAAR